MRITAWISFMAAIIVAGSSLSFARGMLAPPPRFLGGNTGAWIGDGGSGPIFGFDDPWGTDFPFGSGGIGDPGFTGCLDGGEWTRGGGIFSGGYTGGPGDPSNPNDPRNLGCTDKCEEPSLTGDCLPVCYCRIYYQAPDRTVCTDKQNSDWDGRMCRIFTASCEGL